MRALLILGKAEGSPTARVPYLEVRLSTVLKSLASTLLLLLLAIGLGCTSLPLRKETPLRRLILENPHPLAIRLERVGGSIMSLPQDDRIETLLEADRYVVHAGGLSHPAPLLADLVAADSALTVSIASAPIAPAGFVFIPAGPTLIGDVLGVGAPHERPARLVDVAAFFLAEAETTNGEYVEFLNAVKHCHEDWIDLGGPKCRVRENSAGSFETDAPNQPVVTVAYEGAVAYCAWKTAATGIVHRLPTEVEWERAARGPESTTYAYGDVYDLLAANQESGLLKESKSFPPTAWGLYDMTGNAFEWTSSDYTPGLKVLRGGSFVLDGPFLRNSLRMGYRPLVQSDDIGFRVVRETDL